MSIAKQKVKEGKTKSNIKVISKAKIVLANPIKPKVPSLESSDFQQLQKLLNDAIKESNQTGKVYATATNINLGLESTLRSVNNGKAGCVFLSANIKPKYVLGLIARNMEVKDSQVPVYVKPDLENVTQTIFNIRALALTLPRQSKGLSFELQSWVNTHLRPKKTQLPLLAPPTPRIKIAKQKHSAEKTPSATVQSETEDEPKSKPWGSDYISFSNKNAMDIDEETSSNDHEQLQDALEKMINKVNKPNVMVETEDTKSLPAVEAVVEKSTTSKENSDEDDFLGNYAGLTLHKVTPNINRKPRKKRVKKLAKQNVQAT